MSDAEVRGSVVIWGCFKPTKKKSLCFDGGNYQSGFCIGTTEESTYCENKSLKIVQSPNFNSKCNPILSIENARIENNFRVRQVEVETERKTNVRPITISLCGLKVRVFEHGPETSWGSGSDIELKLDGFQYDRIEINEIKGSEKTNGKVTENWCESLARLLFPSDRKFIDKSASAHQYWLSLTGRL